MAGEEYTREYLQYGGQAIPEGVMMRSPHYFSVACRAPNGEIIAHTEAIEKTWIGRQKWLKFPFLRGSLAILDAMALGGRAMRFATKIQLDDAYQPPSDNPQPEPDPISEPAPPTSNRIQDAAIGSTLVIGILIGIGIFVVLPNTIAEQFTRLGVSPMGKNIITEFIKIAFFIGYVGLIGLMPDIRRVFCYHGAEHKAINTLEAGHDLDITNCEAQTRLHPRCGTSFAMIVLILSLLVFTFVPRYPIPDLPGYQNVAIRVFVELMILPIIAGIAYEALRFAGKFRNTKLINYAFKPGLWSQYLTTREPDHSQIEVALVALKQVVASEKEGREVEYVPTPTPLRPEQVHAG
ncbi:MAG TPA: DUF1385 domain-containing protein [Fimbriimonadaceae bacterium]|nr:DUF1385 domain-containing protein [Fimbriimonadaceae bacterium]